MRLVAAWILAALAVSALPAPGHGQAGIKVIVNGVEIPLAAPAVLSGGQVMAPIPGVFEPMGAIAAYFEADRSVLVTNRARSTFRLTVGEAVMRVNGTPRPLAAPPRLVGGVVFIPLQPVFAALGAWTKYEESERTLYVSSQITGLAAEVRDGTLQVSVDATGPVRTETLVLTQPDRMVVDFLHAALRTPAGEVPVSGAGVQRIRTAQFQIKPYITRLVFDLLEPVEVRVDSDAATYRVTVAVRPRGESAGQPAQGGGPAGAEVVKVMGIAFEGDGAGGRVVVDATGPLTYRIREFVYPDRLAIDIENAIFIPVKQDLDLAHPSIVAVRGAQFAARPPVTRIVVTLKRKMNYLVSQSGAGLFVDVNNQMAARRHIVAIDPGHGGRDPGAVGPTGLRESEVVLDIGKRVRDLLVRDGLRVVLVREDDVFVELPDRPRVARDAGASIYVSIHANAHGRATVNGSETYYLTPQSLVLAQMIQDELGIVLRLPSRGIKTGNFLVLRDSGIPSVLVETAFISNPEDEVRLKEGTFRQALAGAIHRGIMRFLAIYPAPAP